MSTRRAARTRFYMISSHSRLAGSATLAHWPTGTDGSPYGFDHPGAARRHGSGVPAGPLARTQGAVVWRRTRHPARPRRDHRLRRRRGRDDLSPWLQPFAVYAQPAGGGADLAGSTLTSRSRLQRPAAAPDPLAGADHPCAARRLHQLWHATALAARDPSGGLVQCVHHRPALQLAAAAGSPGRRRLRAERTPSTLGADCADAVFAVPGIHPGRQTDGRASCGRRDGRSGCPPQPGLQYADAVQQPAVASDRPRR